MALSPKLELRQGQALVMTPQLQQAIKLLQLSTVDLAAYVDAELERNPLLERDGGDGAGGEAGPDDRPEAGDAEPSASDDDWVAETVDKASDAIAESIDADFDQVYPETEAPAAADVVAPMSGLSGPAGGGSGSGSLSGGGEPDLEAYLTRDLTLADHVSEQLALCPLEPAARLIAGALIDHLDDAGYLSAPLTDIATRLGTDEDHVEAVLVRLQGFDPPGVFARSLSECLALQLRDLDRLDPAMAALLDNLDRLAKHDLAGLRRLCGVDDEDLLDMIAEIRALNPKPGMSFGGAPAQTVVPDIFVIARPDGSWHVELNTETLPRVLVNQVYYTTVSKTARSENERSYLSESLQDANWLVKSLEQRARTVLKVAREIVRQQDGFLTYGVSHLRPLNLKTVADAIQMHESTVSRVTANKYMATPRGIYELKYFFTAAIAATDGGEAYSAEAIRHRIKELIDSEAAENILSDDTIVQILRESGVDIARRTVAKYREAMRIPSSVQRRREKRLATA